MRTSIIWRSTALKASICCWFIGVSPLDSLHPFRFRQRTLNERSPISTRCQYATDVTNTQ